MIFNELNLKNSFLIKPNPLKDNRGIFTRIYCKNELMQITNQKEIVQINHSITKKKGALRGMHFQHPPHSEIKMVKCIKGKVFDVIVDLRKGSPTFLQWHGETLTDENMHLLYIPEGFAHGFQTLEDNCELLYFHTAFYSPQSEGGINFKDHKLKITWPIEITEVSERDQGHPFLNHSFQGLEI